jgi:hypothetical protein
MLLEALGYQGAARYVALRWSGGASGDVRLQRRHHHRARLVARLAAAGQRAPLGRAIRDGYDLGTSSEDPADQVPHWLLCDRFEQTLWVGLARDVEALLCTQPSELHAAARIVGGEQVAAVLRRQLEQAPLPSRAQIEAQMRHKRALLDQLRGWLDDLADQIP